MQTYEALPLLPLLLISRPVLFHIRAGLPRARAATHKLGKTEAPNSTLYSLSLEAKQTPSLHNPLFCIPDYATAGKNYLSDLLDGPGSTLLTNTTSWKQVCNGKYLCTLRGRAGRVVMPDVLVCFFPLLPFPRFFLASPCFFFFFVHRRRFEHRTHERKDGRRRKLIVCSWTASRQAPCLQEQALPPGQMVTSRPPILIRLTPSENGTAAETIAVA